jgi:hypothetical protein
LQRRKKPVIRADLSALHLTGWSGVRVPPPDDSAHSSDVTGSFKVASAPF